MNLRLVKDIRIASIIVMWAGLLTKLPWVTLVAFVVWLQTYLHSTHKIEEKLFGEKPDETSNKEGNK